MQGKAALITGAGSGIGRATTRRFAEEGARVMAADLVAEAAAETAGLLREDGLDAASVCVDVTDREAVAEALARAEEELGGLDVVVNNAGITIVGAVNELSDEQWDRELDINLKGVYLVSRAAWPRLRDRGGGCILSTASIAGLGRSPTMLPTVLPRRR